MYLRGRASDRSEMYTVRSEMYLQGRASVRSEMYLRGRASVRSEMYQGHLIERKMYLLGRASVHGVMGQLINRKRTRCISKVEHLFLVRWVI